MKPIRVKHENNTRIKVTSSGASIKVSLSDKNCDARMANKLQNNEHPDAKIHSTVCDIDLR